MGERMGQINSRILWRMESGRGQRGFYLRKGFWKWFRGGKLKFWFVNRGKARERKVRGK